MDDYSQMTDEELDAIINGLDTQDEEQGFGQDQVLVPAIAAAQERTAAEATRPDYTQGMSPLELGLAGIGSDINELYQGIKEKGQLAFAPPGKAGADTVARIQADRAERNRINEQLMSNPEAIAGQFAGSAITAAAAPARVPAQIALEASKAFLAPGSEKPTSLAGELMGSLARSGVAAGTAGVAGKALGALGRTGGATLGKFTPEGEVAMRTKAAAQRLGLPSTSLGQLYPSSSTASIEKALPGYGERVIDQAKALREALDKPIRVPEGDIPNVGAAYVDELANATSARMAQGTDKYKLVDQYVAANNLGSLMPSSSSRVIASQGDPGYEVGSSLLERYGYDLSNTRGVPSKQLATIPLTFEEFHKARVATNKALNTLDRGMATAEKMGASIPAENRAAKNYLTQLKNSLDRDAETWAQKHSGNREALELYKDATQYYRDVVAPTVLDNPIARKATSKSRGFKSGQEGLSAVTSSAGIPMVDRLYPTMTRRGQDMTDVLRNLSDVRATALSKDLQAPETRQGVLQVLRAATGHPVTAVETVTSRVPGMRGLSESNLAARLMGARDVLSGNKPTRISPLQAFQQKGVGGLRDRLAPRQGMIPRTAYGLAQYPQGHLNQKADELFGIR